VRRLGIALGIVVVAALGAYGAAYLYYHAGSPSESCRRIASWGGDARLDHPMQIAWSEGRLYVADTEDGAIEQYHPDGSLVGRWTGFERPVAATVTDGAVYVADFLADQVVKLSPEGEVLARWGRHGTGPGEFDAPAGVAVDGQGNVYVSDFYNHRIQRFDPRGRFLSEWGGEGRTSGHFRYPTGIAVSDQGEVFVADAFNHRVQVFTAEGEYLRQWGGIGFGIGGSWPGWFFLAKEVALDAGGNVYVVDAFNGRLQKFTPEGDLLAIWDPDDPDLAYPSGVAVDAAGTAFISEFYADRVQAVQCR
jgi:tripartite motif-containing protein 71